MRKFSVSLAAAAFCLAVAAGPAQAGKPNIHKGCVKCHKAASQTVRGKLVTVSEKFNTFQVSTGSTIWIVNYDQNLKVMEGEKVSGGETLGKLPKNKEVLISYTGDENTPLAATIDVKQPYELPERQVITVDEVKALVSQGPEKGFYTLIDARPSSVYLQGHIPTALSLPYPAFDKKHASVLPKKKDSLVVFYCGGFT